MVQRKIPDKHGIQADNNLRHDHQNMLIISLSLKKPSSSQHQDGKTRIPEVKKKMMKKSRSFKLSDIGQQTLKKASSQPSRNSISQPGKPPPTLDVTSTFPKALLTPKKQAPVAARSVENSPNYMKSTSCFEARKESQSQARLLSSAKLVTASSSGKKASKSCGGSKLGVRTLTKSPSFKLSRPSSAKKSKRVALCASRDHVNVQRSTCSSTLKDSKFPSYLELNRGGTESEGTSIMKVCPYTYCSLNGHHHKNASLPPLKRFLSAKRRALKTQKSSDVAVPSGKGIRDVEDEESVEKVGVNFFIEIYAETEKKTGFVSPKVEEIHIEEEQVVESLSDGSPQSEFDAEESMERCSEEIGLIEENFSEEESFSSGSASDMEWEFSEAVIEDETDNSSEMDDESESVFGCSLEIENSTADLREDNGLSNCGADTNQECEEDEEEESACFGGEFAEQECEHIVDSLFGEQISCNEDQCGGEENLGEGEEIDGVFDEQNSSEKSEDSSDADKQDNIFDQSSESHEVPKEAEEDNNAEKVSEEIASSDLSPTILESEGELITNVDTSAQDKTDISICNGPDDQSNAKLNKSEMGEPKKKPSPSQVGKDIADEELRNKWSIGKRRINDSDDESTRKFNPREPNYLPLVADPDGEKVDLKHQEIDERKNSEDWMIDHALQQAVTKLGPARKRRVALLVEAFETVSPITKFEPNRLHHHHPTSPVFSHAIRPIQACN